MILLTQLCPFYQDVDECAEGTDGCSQICTNTIGIAIRVRVVLAIAQQQTDVNVQVRVLPSDHFQFYGGSLEIMFIIIIILCLDIDECAEGSHLCDQTCTNMIGSYSCSCGSSYRLASNRLSCTDIMIRDIIMMSNLMLASNLSSPSASTQPQESTTVTLIAIL